MDKKNMIKDHLDTSFDYDGIIVSTELIQRTMAAIKAEEDKKAQEKKHTPEKKRPRYIRRYIYSLGVASAAMLLLIGGMQVWKISNKNLTSNEMIESAPMQENQFVTSGSNQDQAQDNAEISDSKMEQAQEGTSQIQNEENAKKESSNGITIFSQNSPFEGVEVVKLFVKREEVSREIEDKEIISEIVKMIEELTVSEDIIHDNIDETESDLDGENKLGRYQLILLTDTKESFEVLIGSNIQIRKVEETEYKEYKMDKTKGQESNLFEKLEELMEKKR